MLTIYGEKLEGLRQKLKECRELSIELLNVDIEGYGNYIDGYAEGIFERINSAYKYMC